jgi:cell division initiation protein
MNDQELAQAALDVLETVTFRQTMRGYSVDEVDDFLERVSHEVRELRDRLASQQQQLRQAAERIAQLDQRGPAAAPSAVPTPTPITRLSPAEEQSQIVSMLQMAQQFTEKTRAEAEQKAVELTQAAQERAKEIVAEARNRAEDDLVRLNGMKQRLSEDVESLRRKLDSDRARVSEVLTELAHWVERSLRSEAVEPKSAPADSTPPPPPSAPTPPPASAGPHPVSPPPAPAPRLLSEGFPESGPTTP